MTLDEKYIEKLSPSLPNFRKVKDGVYRFRCIFCSLSETNPKKWKGYLYLKSHSYNYFCHRCNHRSSLKVVMKELNPNLFRKYQLETSQDVSPPNLKFSPEHLRIISKGKQSKQSKNSQYKFTLILFLKNLICINMTDRSIKKEKSKHKEPIE